MGDAEHFGIEEISGFLMFLRNASWLYQSGQLMTKLKQAQLQAQFLKQNQKMKGTDSDSLLKEPLSYINTDLINRLRRRPQKETLHGDSCGTNIVDAAGLNGESAVSHHHPS
ncbi:hypothetical protein RUM43_009005 [Polyplax serrata]|uniref:Uncharacterized protein n=1 Tax=Polyplax serrata TaxID=468196 RepID=A0AAN8PHF9_POLSC